MNRRGELATARGTNEGSFQALDWGLMAAVSLIWGSSFLWIAIGVDHLEPGVVACLRVALGSAALFTLPAARRTIDRSDWWAVAVVAVAGNGGPALLFAMAETELESAVAGMINSGAPIATLVVAFLLGNRAVSRRHVAGIVLGFVGIVLMALPSVVGADAPVAGVTFVIIAVFGYGVTTNVIVPLQQRYGGMAVIAWAQAGAAVLLLPLGVAGIGDSDFSTRPLIAVVILGVIGTGFARALSATLFGRTGAHRGSVVTYFVPIVAIVLGVVFRAETVELVQIVGLAAVLAAGVMVARR